MLTATTFTDAPDRPLLLLGPSVGTTAETLWARCAGRLYGRYHVVGWDLPGHGRSAPAAGPYTIADLAREVLALAERIRPGEAFGYAGDSIGGAVGLQLLLDAPERVTAAALLCTGAKIGEPSMWHDRAKLVRAEGMEAVVAGSRERWFAPGFTGAEPLIAALRATDAESYARACEALAGFDVRDRLAEIAAPVLAVAGGHDKPTPVDSLAAIADGVLHGRLVVLDDVAHLAPAEAPEVVATLLDQHFDELRAAGIGVRREVLGPAHVDRATAGTTAFTRDFQDMITRYAWAEIWTRPGLQRRDRSLITLTALIALGHHEELAMHVRAARTNGLSDDEIKELILQTAIYCGVPAANTAFRIAQRVLTELDEEQHQ
ncbi:3-oxoadipate enol-lactonase/4-carboxymuconolactone decarboxylase [Actinoplanes campanulatus]|uniref:3-oxoadipate enol-lactonase/4-carboxymuconolactone decarboxylase n=1 Tax=Actinoplanes campanulatus TaxID=113559 RepID=A0A7W5AG24_9ACTN|nr:4-carboxymuconolactone decarboxylase [Actinoplanes campanulatus]MBB3095407.1 3-oxoadipate enol-lactonase/4-carboxymuconolactone decarboxylase [Actinoplanes campanulatus]GGN41941.1 3-oxoadipate enol-lactonase [Actinoplanes campanulatus]GID35010.1 3-oxoadipate enol-lactonase [Actinoplanes campanulatus]